MGDFRKKYILPSDYERKKIPALNEKSLIAYNAEKNGQPI